MRRSTAFLLGLLFGWPLWVTLTVLRRHPTAPLDAAPPPLSFPSAEPTEIQEPVEIEIQKPVETGILGAIDVGDALQGDALKAMLAREEALYQLGDVLENPARWVVPWGLVLVIVALAAPVYALGQVIIGNPYEVSNVLLGFPLVLTAAGSACVVLSIAWRSRSRRAKWQLATATETAKRLRGLDWEDPIVVLREGEKLGPAVSGLSWAQRRALYWIDWASGMEVAGALLLFTGAILAWFAWQEPPRGPVPLQDTLRSFFQVAVTLHQSLIV